MPTFLQRYALALGISVTALLISIALDRILAPLSPIPQFIIQVPLLVLLFDEIRRVLIQSGAFREEDVIGAVFFAAPLAALGATTLFKDLQKSLSL